MNKLLLLLGLIAVDCGWDNHSMLIAEMQAQAKPLPSATASPAAEDENKPQVLQTSPSGTFRVVQGGEEFWIVTGRRKATDKNAFGGTGDPRGVSLFAGRKVVVYRAASRVVYVGRGSLPGKR